VKKKTLLIDHFDPSVVTIESFRTESLKASLILGLTS
jgi:hypothetical protein